MQVTGFEAETKRLADAGVLIDTFFLGRGVDPNFAWIADQSKGASYALNICTPAGARDLVDSVTARCLFGAETLNLRMLGTTGGSERIREGSAIDQLCSRVWLAREGELGCAILLLLEGWMAWNGCGAVPANISHPIDAVYCCVRRGCRILMHVGGASDGSRLVVEYQKRYKMHT